MPKLLFIVKNRTNLYGSSFGLLNSAQFVVNALNKTGIESKAVAVVDNNGIDREVSTYKPTHVIIEALWVIPDKFDILTRLHPNVKWIVRIHSKIPFLSAEGIAIDWIKKYPKNIYLAANSKQACHDIKQSMGIPCLYLPNIYCIQTNPNIYKPVCNKFIDVGCFGAIRPLKNQLIQAFAAIQFANNIGKKLRFHINCDRIEQRGSEIYKNLKNLFPIGQHELVEHPWLDHSSFIELVKTMDLGMQVSYTESFNIVTADFVQQNVPIIVSPDIDWLPFLFRCNPNSTQSMVNKLWLLWILRKINVQFIAKWFLKIYNQKALKAWLKNI